LERLRQRLERLHRRLVLVRQQLVPGLLQRLPQVPWLPVLERPRMLELLPGR
jgi:hypothetical protein